MQTKTLFFLCLVFTVAILSTEAGGGGGKKHKVIVHIPYHVKTIKHTHTIYKIVHDKKHDHKDYEHGGYDHGW